MSLLTPDLSPDLDLRAEAKRLAEMSPVGVRATMIWRRLILAKHARSAADEMLACDSDTQVTYTALPRTGGLRLWTKRFFTAGIGGAAVLGLLYGREVMDAFGLPQPSEIVMRLRGAIAPLPQPPPEDVELEIYFDDQKIS